MSLVVTDRQTHLSISYVIIIMDRPNAFHNFLLLKNIIKFINKIIFIIFIIYIYHLLRVIERLYRFIVWRHLKGKPLLYYFNIGDGIPCVFLSIFHFIKFKKIKKNKIIYSFYNIIFKLLRLLFNSRLL